MPVSTPAISLDKFTTFGDLLKYLRRRAGLTQRELSIAVGYSDAQISRLEQNLRQPDLPTVEARFPAGEDVRAGDVVLLLDGGGQADLFDVESVVGSAAQLRARGPVSGRQAPAGAWLIPVTVASYYLKAGTAADGLQLISGNGGSSELPFVDHVASLEVRLLGEPQPPRLGSPGSPPERATYGPTPPPPGVDNPRDEWPAGENCTFVMSGGRQESRLAVLDAGTGLVILPPGLLTDGPWCPDAAAPNRVDADLLRVREVRVVLRLEAASPAVRGGDARLFAHPGTARDQSRWVPDRQVTIDVVPRALHVGR